MKAIANRYTRLEILCMFAVMAGIGSLWYVALVIGVSR
jgi:UPF0716 family protein affecting phage T7 exclusion